MEWLTLTRSQIGWLVTAAAASVAAAAFLLVRRFQWRDRVRLSILATAVVLLTFLGLRLRGVIDQSSFLVAILAVIGLQVLIYAGRIGARQSILIGDPLLRRKKGLAQYDDRSVWFWTVLLLFSPWHLIRYKKYVNADPQSPSREFFAEDDGRATH